MPTIQERIKHITATIPTNVRLVAVSKYQPEEYILDAYSAGQRIFGESHAQELRLKHEHLPKDIEWHFIGHLQTNKIKYIAVFAFEILFSSADFPLHSDRGSSRHISISSTRLTTAEGSIVPKKSPKVRLYLS